MTEAAPFLKDDHVPHEEACLVANSYDMYQQPKEWAIWMRSNGCGPAAKWVDYALRRRLWRDVENDTLALPSHS
jgi:hypothetical protein